jgi:polyisoprenoid-binding protein YceI
MTTTLATWTIDPVHSSVEFSLDYMGFSTYRTGFRALEGSLAFDAARPAASSVNASILVASVDVTNDRLMSRLMDPDLLGGKDHPTITFKSTRVEALDQAHWNVTGDLTIHGVARPVVLDTRYLGQAMHPFSKKIAAAFRAETAIDRRDFGVTWNAAMDTGGAYLGERVQIALAILALRQD